MHTHLGVFWFWWINSFFIVKYFFSLLLVIFLVQNLFKNIIGQLQLFLFFFIFYFLFFAFFFFFCFFFFFFFFFLGLHSQHIEVPRLGVESELQLPACATATAVQDLSSICDLLHSSWQHQILNPLSEARDRSCILVNPRWVC